MSKNKTQGWLHGECLVMRIDALPEGAKEIKPTEGYLKVADSETTGNHHVVDVSPGVNFFESGGKHYMTVAEGKEANMRCVLPSRHDNEKLGPGTYEFDFQQEEDHLTNSSRRVRD